MRSLLLALPLTFLMFAVANAQTSDPAKDLQRLVLTPDSPPLIRIYDRFEDRTRYWTEPVLVGRGLDLTATFSYRGKGAGHAVDMLGLVFSSKSTDWRYLKDSRLYCLIDGQSLDVGSALGRDSNVKTGSNSVRVEETLIFHVSYQTLEKIAKVKRLEMRLGSTELYSTSEFQDRLKVLLDKVKVVK